MTENFSISFRDKKNYETCICEKDRREDISLNLTKLKRIRQDGRAVQGFLKYTRHI